MRTILVIALALISTGLFAQDEKYKKIRALKTAYITEDLNLSPEEAAKFWPIYNRYDDKILVIRTTRKKVILEKLNNGLEAMTDEEANMVLDESIAVQSTELEYRKELINSLRKILPPKKIVALSRAENSFKRKLLKQYRGDRKN